MTAANTNTKARTNAAKAVATKPATKAATKAPATKPATIDPKVKAAIVSRETTKAIRSIDANTAMINVGTTHAKVVKMSTGSLRIDHTNCEHATSGNDGKKARAKCRNAIEKHIRDAAK